MLQKEIQIPIIIDTNELVPTLYNFTRLAEFISDGNLLLVWNMYMQNEAERIIKKLAPRYQKSGVTEQEATALLYSFYGLGIQVSEMPPDWPSHSLDRNDDPFLWAAEQGGAEYIISSDIRHMIRLGSFKGIPIGQPGDFFVWAKRYYPMEDYIWVHEV